MSTGEPRGRMWPPPLAGPSSFLVEDLALAAAGVEEGDCGGPVVADAGIFSTLSFLLAPVSMSSVTWSLLAFSADGACLARSEAAVVAAAATASLEGVVSCVLGARATAVGLACRLSEKRER